MNNWAGLFSPLNGSKWTIKTVRNEVDPTKAYKWNEQDPILFPILNWILTRLILFHFISELLKKYQGEILKIENLALQRSHTQTHTHTSIDKY